MSKIIYIVHLHILTKEKCICQEEMEQDPRDVVARPDAVSGSVQVSIDPVGHSRGREEAGVVAGV